MLLVILEMASKRDNPYSMKLSHLYKQPQACKSTSYTDMLVMIAMHANEYRPARTFLITTLLLALIMYIPTFA